MSDPNAMSPQWARGEPLRVLDRDFGAWVAQHFAAGLDEAQADVLRRLASAVSFALHLKHTCLDLERYRALNEPALDALLEGIDAKDVIALPETAMATDARNVPLVRSKDGTRLWLQKYFVFERSVAQQVRQRLADAGTGMEIAAPTVKLLDALYADDAPSEQRQAVETALRHRLSVITGGPGTGKTWTVARIIAALKQADPGSRIALAAPTGKAANRMMESLLEAIQALQERLELDDLEGLALPQKATTLHALLGIGRASPLPRRNRLNPLQIDALILDEASMVDLPMMSRVLDALPTDARLVLLGDRNQLSSVEAGGVLADLCRTGPGSVYRDGPAPVATLKHNFRSVKAIRNLADRVNEGEAASLATDETYAEAIGFHPGDATGAAWTEHAARNYRALGEEWSPDMPAREALARLGRFQVLCGLRQGPFGVEGINAAFEHRFGREFTRVSGQSSHRAGRAWYPGLPVMVLQNDHERRLYNGDIGLVLPVTEREDEWLIDPEGGTLRACFPAADNEVRAIGFAQMPPFESSYALTVHKSQGSEYDEVLLVLPMEAEAVAMNPVLARELLYTAVTRAKRRLEVWCGEGVLETMARKATVRMSGLSDH